MVEHLEDALSPRAGISTLFPSLCLRDVPPPLLCLVGGTGCSLVPQRGGSWGLSGAPNLSPTWRVERAVRNQQLSYFPLLKALREA